MSKYKKENHIEFSDGGTDFISTRACPMTDAEVDKNTNVLSDCNVICCRNSDKDYMCGDFYGFLMTDDGKTTIQCAGINKVREHQGSPAPVEIFMGEVEMLRITDVQEGPTFLGVIRGKVDADVVDKIIEDANQKYYDDNEDFYPNLRAGLTKEGISIITEKVVDVES